MAEPLNPNKAILRWSFERCPPNSLYLYLPIQSDKFPSVCLNIDSYFILGNFFSDVNTFIIVVLLSALDFWTVKNVTGRLLVGLRWWNDFDQNGKQIWRFESYDQQFQANAIDKSFFWTSQYASTGTWAAFFVMKILSFSIFWSLLVLINLSLSAINLYGFYKCSGCRFHQIQLEHNKKMGELKKKLGQQGAKMFMNNMLSGVFGSK